MESSLSFCLLYGIEFSTSVNWPTSEVVTGIAQFFWAQGVNLVCPQSGTNAGGWVDSSGVSLRI